MTAADVSAIVRRIKGARTGETKPKKPSKMRQKAAQSAGERELARQLHVVRIYGWICEFKFDLKRRWRVDFAWPDRLLAVEIEGGVWTDGRHTRGAGFEADCEKYAELAILGWRLIRVTPQQVKNGKALQWVVRALTP